MSEQVTGYTPGPWTTEPHGDTTALYSGRTQDQHGFRLMNLDDGDANFDANARLIASAPDLAVENAQLRERVAALTEALRPFAEASILPGAPEGGSGMGWIDDPTMPTVDAFRRAALALAGDAKS